MNQFLNLLRLFKRALAGEGQRARQLRESCGLSFAEYLRLTARRGHEKSEIFGQQIRTTTPFWHLHSLEEIFRQQLYSFDPGRSRPVIVDCGANVGLSVIFFANRFPQAEILAFEPDPVLFAKLQENVRTLGLKGVQLVPAAVSSRAGKVRFHSSGDLGGRIEANEQSSGTSLVEVETIRLKTELERIFEQHGSIDMLKIDIEGEEWAVLEDCRDVLPKVANLFVELHRRKGEDLPIHPTLALLEKAGFRIYIKESWDNLPQPFQWRRFRPLFDFQINLFAYRH